LKRSTIHRDGAFHWGGRRELQFNIWLDDDDTRLRHGVGFFFLPNRNLRDPIKVLRPKVIHFNKFMQLYPRLYKDMEMWYYDEKGKRIPITLGPIPDELVIKDEIVFLGRLPELVP